MAAALAQSRRPPVRIAAECGLVMPPLLDRCAPEAGPTRVALGPWPETVAGAAPAQRVGGKPAPGEQWGRPLGRSARWQKRLVGRWPAGWARGWGTRFCASPGFHCEGQASHCALPDPPRRGRRASGGGGGWGGVPLAGRCPWGCLGGRGTFPSQGNARTCSGSRLAATDLFPGDPLLSRISRAWGSPEVTKGLGVSLLGLASIGSL